MTGPLCRHCMVMGSATLLRAIEVVGPPEYPPARVQVHGLVQHLAAITGVPAEKIEGPGRHRALVDLRRAVTFVAREATDLSYPVIARLMNGRDHSTMINLRRTAEVLIARDPDFAWLVERLWAAAECAPFGPDATESYEPVRVFENPRHKRPAIETRRDAKPSAHPPVRTEPGEYMPRHALPPVLAVVEDETGDSGEAWSDEDTHIGRDAAIASAALLAALRREHPERMVA